MEGVQSRHVDAGVQVQLARRDPARGIQAIVALAQAQRGDVPVHVVIAGQLPRERERLLGEFAVHGKRRHAEPPAIGALGEGHLQATVETAGQSLDEGLGVEAVDVEPRRHRERLGPVDPSLAGQRALRRRQAQRRPVEALQVAPPVQRDVCARQRRALGGESQADPIVVERALGIEIEVLDPPRLGRTVLRRLARALVRAVIRVLGRRHGAGQRPLQLGAGQAGGERHCRVQGVEAGRQAGFHGAAGGKRHVQVAEIAGQGQLEPLAGQGRQAFGQVEVGAQLHVEGIVIAQGDLGLEGGIGLPGGGGERVHGDALVAGGDAEVEPVDDVGLRPLEGRVFHGQTRHLHRQRQGDVRQPEALLDRRVRRRRRIAHACGGRGDAGRQRRAHRHGGVDRRRREHIVAAFRLAQGEPVARRDRGRQPQPDQPRRRQGQGVAFGLGAALEVPPAKAGAVGETHLDVIQQQLAQRHRQRQLDRLGRAAVALFRHRLLGGVARAEADAGALHGQAVDAQPPLEQAVVGPGELDVGHRDAGRAGRQAQPLDPEGVQRCALDALDLEQAEPLGLGEQGAGAPGRQGQAQQQHDQADQPQRQQDQQPEQGPAKAAHSHDDDSRDGVVRGMVSHGRRG